MNRTNNIGDLMGFFGLGSSPVFAQFYNTVFAPGENQNLDMRGAKWGQLQDVFTYEMYERFSEVEVMATFTDLYSDPRAMSGTAKYKKLTGAIPRHKALMTIGEEDITDKKHQIYGMRSALHGRSDVEQAVERDLEDWYYGKLAQLPNAHKNTINFMLGQLKSTLDFKLDDRTNPGGIKGLVFPSHVPQANRRTVKFWTVGLDGKITYNTEVNPVEYLQELVQEIKNDPAHSYDKVTVEMNAKSFKNLLKHPAFAKTIAYALDNSFYRVVGNDANAIAYGGNWLLTAKQEAKIEIFKQILEIDQVLLSETVVGTESIVKMTDAAPSIQRNKMDCFEEGRMLLRPSGRIIDIIPVAPNRTDHSSVISTDIFSGRGLLEYWYDPREKVSTWRSELTCLPVFTVPSQCYNVAFTEKEKAPVYTAVSSPSGNPSTKGYYEKNADGSYSASTDTTVQSGKTYYTKS